MPRSNLWVLGSAVGFLLGAWTCHAQSLLVAWEYDPGMRVTQWQLLMVRSAGADTAQTTETLIPLAAAQCQQDVEAKRLGPYVAGETWCAQLPCPGGAAYAFVLQAVVGDTESGPSNVATMGLSATCQLIPYDEAIGTAFPTAAVSTTPASLEVPTQAPAAPGTPPAVPVPVEVPALPKETPAPVVPSIVAGPVDLGTIQAAGDALVAHYEQALTALAQEYHQALAMEAPASHGATYAAATAQQQALYQATLEAWQALVNTWDQGQPLAEGASITQETSPPVEEIPRHPHREKRHRHRYHHRHQHRDGPR